ncbi:MAG: 3-isopropylmalate dehydrogenase [Chloroflexi bacterium]|nr:3-isopropylmalate dehydrogenase [Chloroflexota bacterium]
MVHRIAVIPGDNIGPEVVAEGLKVLRRLQALGFGPFAYDEYPWGAGYYLKTGAPMPADGLDTIRDCDAILFGAHGDPQRVPDRVSSQGLMHKLRKGFQQYVNLRPVRLLPGVVSPLRGKDEIDFVVVRENTEGEYSGMGGRLHAGTPYELATQTTVITRIGAERVMRFAFDLARQRGGKKRAAAATKSNALSHVFGLWDEVLAEVANDYPDVECHKFHIDAFTVHLINRPEWFDVIVASNLFGDILSDEGAALAGSLGMAPSANLDPTRRHPSLFEPIHGSAPDIAGQGIANPVATILAVRMLLDWLGEAEAARRVQAAVEAVLAEGQVRTRDLGGRSTTAQLGDAICARLEAV